MRETQIDSFQVKILAALGIDCETVMVKRAVIILEPHDRVLAHIDVYISGDETQSRVIELIDSCEKTDVTDSQCD